MTLSKVFKVSFVIIAILAIGYSLISIYSLYFLKDVSCLTKPVIVNPSVNKKHEAIITNTICDDGRPIKSRVYLKFLESNKKELIYEAYSDEKLDIYVIWKSSASLDLLIPSYQEKYGEVRYDSTLTIHYRAIDKSLE